MQNQTTLPPVKPRPYLLQGQIQHYAWGTRDDAAFIPKLLGFTPEPGLPYAELWIGAHPKAPSMVLTAHGTVPLDRWIARYPTQILGEAAAAGFANALPFLFKVLSAGESLSIQAHPNKAQAAALHARDPEHYRDANHKPEVAIALDALTALVGLKPRDALAETLARYPEIAGFIGKDVCEQYVQSQSVETLFSALIRRSVTHVEDLRHAIEALAGRLITVGIGLTETETLFLDLRQKYPGADVGLFALFLLNLVHLEKGQGIFTGPGIPHAYLKGNIIECMANSDNVVRIGLTPKFKDAETLLDILDYDPHPVTILGAPSGSGDAVYTTPAPEFQVSRWELPLDTSREETTGDSIEVLLVTQGQIQLRWHDATGRRVQTFDRGQAVLIPACLSAFDVRANAAAEVFKAEVPATH